MIVNLDTGDASGGHGDDTIFTMESVHRIRRALGHPDRRHAGSNDLDGLGGHDIMYGLAGKDDLTGGPGIDKLYGGGGGDAMRGNAHNDTLNGGIGNDDMLGGTGRDACNGGIGTDTADFHCETITSVP